MAIWDYGCGAPYMPMNMCSGSDGAKDAIVFSPHKFPGGPGASGMMIVRDAIVKRKTPTLPGGGTVSVVSPWGHSYSDQVAAREEGGTPNVIGDIRVALAMLVKEALGEDWLQTRQTQLRKWAEADHPYHRPYHAIIPTTGHTMSSSTPRARADSRNSGPAPFCSTNT